MSMNREQVQAIFRVVHNREIVDAEIARWINSGASFEAMLRGALGSEEYRNRIKREFHIRNEPFRETPLYLAHTRHNFRCPRELAVTPTPLKRVLLVGYCLLAEWPHALRSLGVEAGIDHVLPVHGEAPRAPHPPEAYSFQLLQIANRALFGDYAVMQWVRSGYGAVEAAEAQLETAKADLDRLLETWADWRRHMPVFVTTLTPPQQEFNGRLVPRRGADSILVFFERLNAYLAERVAALDNLYLIDLGQIFASIGTRHMLDDISTISAHASLLGDDPKDRPETRLIPSRPLSEHYDLKTRDAIAAVWFEAEAMYRTLLQIDQVKMICVDLDDTLWRGVLAESADLDDVDPYEAREGWPLGIVEALAILKRRGILLCLVSKNDEARVRALFEKVYRGVLALDDFAILKINWAPKPQNIAEAMAEANLLPRSVVFLGDNPVERAAVRQAFPEIRVIDAPLYYWRRILLWSAETQTADITPESARRTEMVHAQVARETLRAASGHEDFLAGLGLELRIAAVAAEGGKFERALELLNKSNQFNTTGRRWTRAELVEATERGLVISAAVRDRFTDYGDTLIAVASEGRIAQLVMSCRVVGLGVEIAVVAALAGKLLQGREKIAADLRNTDANVLARDLWSRCGFLRDNDEWIATAPPQAPAHIVVESAF